MKMLEYISALEAANKWGISKDEYRSYVKEIVYPVLQSSAVRG